MTRSALRILALVLAPAVLPAAAQEGLSGSWRGHWEREGSTLPVEITFSEGASGYQGAFSSAQLRVVGIPLTGIRFEAPVVRWDIVGDQTPSHFEGALQGETLSGHFREGDATGTFRLARGSAAAPLHEEEVTFSHGGLLLSGTVVKPEGPGPFPGVVFLHGSGPEGRWASRYLAQELARRGVASLIYDKRGVGRSAGDWRNAGFLDLVGDAGAAIDALKARPYIAPDRVGIHGHSQGATIAPWLASERPDLAFVVASAPGGVPMAELERFSLGNSLRIHLLPGPEKELAERFVHAMVATAYEGAPRSELDRVWEAARDRPWAFQPPPPSDPYWSFSRRIASYDSSVYWRRVKAPALLLFGERDERVPARPSAARIAEAYLGGGGTRLEVLIFPHADHGYRLPQHGEHFAWPQTAPGYPAQMIEWILRVAGP